MRTLRPLAAAFVGITSVNASYISRQAAPAPTRAPDVQSMQKALRRDGPLRIGGQTCDDFYDCGASYTCEISAELSVLGCCAPGDCNFQTSCVGYQRYTDLSKAGVSIGVSTIACTDVEAGLCISYVHDLFPVTVFDCDSITGRYTIYPIVPGAATIGSADEDSPNLVSMLMSALESESINVAAITSALGTGAAPGPSASSGTSKTASPSSSPSAPASSKTSLPSPDPGAAAAAAGNHASDTKKAPIAAIVVPTVVVPLAALAGIAFIFLRRRKRGSESQVVVYSQVPKDPSNPSSDGGAGGFKDAALVGGYGAGQKIASHAHPSELHSESPPQELPVMSTINQPFPPRYPSRAFSGSSGSGMAVTEVPPESLAPSDFEQHRVSALSEMPHGSERGSYTAYGHPSPADIGGDRTSSSIMPKSTSPLSFTDKR